MSWWIVLPLALVANTSSVRTDAAKVLSQDKYAFCRDDIDAPIVDEALRYCPFVESLKSTCPGLAKACESADVLPTPCEMTVSECSGRGISIPGAMGGSISSGGGEGGGSGWLPPGHGGTIQQQEFGDPLAQGEGGGGGGGEGGGPLGEPGQGGGGAGGEFRDGGMRFEPSDPAGGGAAEGGEALGGPEGNSAGGELGPEGSASAGGIGESAASNGPDSAGEGGGAGDEAGGPDSGAASAGQESAGAEGESTPGFEDSPQDSNEDDSKEEEPEEEEPEEEEPEEEEPEEEPEEEDEDLSLIGWIILGVLGGLGLAALIRKLILLRRKKTDEDDVPEAAEEDDGENPAPTVSAEPLHIVETDVQRLLRLAREAIAKGEHRRAVDETYAALLRRLSGDGLIELDITRTNGDHIHSLAADAQLQTDVSSAILDVERVQFGQSDATQTAAGLLERVSRIVARRIAPLAVLLAILSGLSCTGPGEGAGREVVLRESGGLLGRGVSATGPMGSAAMMEVLERNDADVEYHPGDYADLVESPEPIFLLGGAVPTAEEWDTLLKWAQTGGTLAIAAWPGAVDPRTGAFSGWAACDPQTALELRSPLAFQEPMGAQAQVPALAHLVSSDQRPLTPLIMRGENTYAAIATVGEGRIIIFADDYLFTNASMAVDDNAPLTLAIFDWLGEDGTVRVIDSWTAVGSDGAFEVLSDPRMAPIVLQFLAFLTLLYLWRGTIFGRARDPKSDSRRAFSDHVRAMGGQYARLKASDYMLGAYGSWAIEQLRARVPGGSRLELHELAQQVAARSGRDPAALTSLLTAVSSPEAIAKIPKRVRLTLRRDLARLLTEVGGKR